MKHSLTNTHLIWNFTQRLRNSSLKLPICILIYSRWVQLTDESGFSAEKPTNNFWLCEITHNLWYAISRHFLFIFMIDIDTQVIWKSLHKLKINLKLYKRNLSGYSLIVKVGLSARLIYEHRNSHQYDRTNLKILIISSPPSDAM